MRVDGKMMILFQNAVRVVCYGLIAVFVLMMLAVQTMPNASSFAISAKTEYFEGVVDGDGTTFSAQNARICAADDAFADAPACTRSLSEAASEFTGRISLPSGIRLRIRRGNGPLNQLFLESAQNETARLRLVSADSGDITYAALPARIDLKAVTSGAPMMINLAGHSAVIGAVATRDSSGLRNALRNGEILVYGIGLWWHLTGDPTAPVKPSQLFKVGSESLQFGDSVSLSTATGPGEEPVEYWANVGFDPDGIIEVSLRAVGDAAVVERFGGSGLLLRKSWMDPLIKDPLFQVLWSVFGTMIALAGIQFLGRNPDS